MRSVLALGLLITTYVQANVLLSPRATLFPVGPTNRPVTGWITLRPPLA
jgi:hypothetical protein